MTRPYPTQSDVPSAVEGRAAVFPSLLWRELGGGDEDLAPLWLLDRLQRLGYRPLPAGFWWRGDIPTFRAQRLASFVRTLDSAYPK